MVKTTSIKNGHPSKGVVRKKAFANKHKSLSRFGEPSNEDFEQIKELLPSEVQKADIFVYSVRLCDNLLDRDGEIFSLSALEQLSQYFHGKVGIYDHDWSSDNIHSRIYKTELVEDNTKENELQEPYRYIIGYAYTLNNAKNKDLIDSIKAGILKEVSIGFESSEGVAKETPEGKELVVTEDITDVFEWSFVAVPAQPGAGVVKSYKQEVIRMNKEEIIKNLKSAGVANTVLSAVEELISEDTASTVNSLKTKLKTYESTVADQEKKLKELESELVAKTLSAGVAEALKGLTPANEHAKEMATDIVSKSLEIDEKGEVQGVAEVKETLLKHYPFLFIDTEEHDIDDEYEEEYKEADLEEKSKSYKPSSLGFSRSEGKVALKSAKVTPSKKFGISYE